MIDIHKRIFITGATGFIGANLLRRLIELGASDVHILTRSSSHLDRIVDILDRVTVHHFSLEEREDVLAAIRSIRPQIVFHIAASGTAVGRTPLSIDELYRANTLSSIHLMDACYEVGGCEAFVHTGSSSEYGQKDTPMQESDVLVPNNLYGISKAGATEYATYIGQQQGFPIVTYRIFAAYGPYEDKKRLIPTLLSASHQGISPSLSSPFPVRDFIYIDDIITCYLSADKAIGTPGDIINVATGIQHSIGEVVDMITTITKNPLTPLYGQTLANQMEPKTWVADISKMKHIFPFSPISLEDGLSLTLQWIKKSL